MRCFTTMLLYVYASEYAIRKTEANQQGLILNWTHQLLVQGDDVNLLNKNKDKNCLEVKPRTQTTLLSHEQTVGQNHNTKVIKVLKVM